jgi:hypothetical protein
MIYEVTGASASTGLSTTELVVGTIAAVGIGALALSYDDDDNNNGVAESPQTPVADEPVEDEEPVEEEPIEEEPPEEDPVPEPPVEEPVPDEPVEEDPVVEEPIEEEPIVEEPVIDPPMEDPMTPPPVEDPVEDTLIALIDGVYEGQVQLVDVVENLDGHPISSLESANVRVTISNADSGNATVEVEIFNPGAGGLTFVFQGSGPSVVELQSLLIEAALGASQGTFETFLTEAVAGNITLTGDGTENAGSLVFDTLAMIFPVAVGTDEGLPDSNSNGVGDPLRVVLEIILSSVD